MLGDLKKYRELMSYIGPFKGRRRIVLLLCTGSIVLGTILPYMLGNLVTLVQNNSSFENILNYGLKLIILGIMATILNSIQNYQWHIYNVEFINYFRTRMLDAAFKKELSYFKDNDEDFSTRILHDSNIVAQDISIGLPMLMLNVLRLGLVIFLMLKMSIRLTIVTLTVIPAYTFLFNRIDSSIKENSKKEREGFSLLSSTVKEYLDGIFQIKVYGKEDYFLNSFESNVQEYEKHTKNIKKYTSLSYGVSKLVTTLLPIVILIIGAIEVGKSNMSIGFLFAFYAYLNFLYEPMENLSNWYTNLQISLGMSDRILSFLNEGQQYEDKSLEVIESIDNILFDNFSFSYDLSKVIIKDFNAEFNRGDIIGIVGPSGSGKSTLIDILLKVWDNYSGSIKVNGMELKEISRESYYKKVSILEQEPFLFRGTIYQNIAFDMQDDDLVDTSLDVSVSKKITKEKEYGLDTMIQTKGINLSGGEKQRIALSRVAFKTSDLIILDEFTSALDKEIESEVVQNMKNYAEGKILIIITHRPEPLSICNKIIDMSDYS